MLLRRHFARGFILFFLLVCLFGVLGCASTPLSKTREQVNQLVIRNMTSAPLYNVDLRIPDREVLVSVNLILPHREYSLGFPAREHARATSLLSWVHRTYKYEKSVDTHIPENLDTSYPARVVILIGDSGQVWSEVEPYYN